MVACVAPLLALVLPGVRSLLSFWDVARAVFPPLAKVADKTPEAERSRSIPGKTAGPGKPTRAEILSFARAVLKANPPEKAKTTDRKWLEAVQTWLQQCGELPGPDEVPSPAARRETSGSVRPTTPGPPRSLPR
jgi:hypothetical protein